MTTQQRFSATAFQKTLFQLSAGLEAARNELVERQFSATRGPVTIRCNGEGRVHEVSIEGDEVTSDLILACFKALEEDVNRAQQEIFNG